MPTKTEMIEQIREILEECFNDPTPINQDHKHFKFFSALCRNHPKADDPQHAWKYKDIDEFIVTVAMYGKGKALYTVHNGEQNVISWHKCCGVKKNKLNCALRDIIQEDTKQFRRKNELCCRNCGVTELPSNRFHVDHIYPFSKIRDEFFLTRQKPTKFGDLEPYGNCFLPADKKLGEEWYAYHKERATYQILCDKCNMSKGAKVQS